MLTKRLNISYVCINLSVRMGKLMGNQPHIHILSDCRLPLMMMYESHAYICVLFILFNIVSLCINRVERRSFIFLLWYST